MVAESGAGEGGLGTARGWCLQGERGQAALLLSPMGFGSGNGMRRGRGDAEGEEMRTPQGGEQQSQPPAPGMQLFWVQPGDFRC